MANAYVIAQPWPLATAPQVSVQPMQKFATSVHKTMTPVAEDATMEVKYDSLLKDYKDLQWEYECLERNKRSMQQEVHSQVLEIETANNTIQKQSDRIARTLLGI